MGGDGHGEAMMDRGNKYMTREGRMVQVQGGRMDQRNMGRGNDYA